LASLAGLVFAMNVGERGNASDLAPEFAKLIVGVALPLWLMRRWGWRLSVKQNASREYGEAYIKGFQFSIVDLLVLTTGVAIFVALLTLDGSVGIGEDFATTALFISTVVVAGIISFLLNRNFLMVICLVGVGVLMSSIYAINVLLFLSAGACLCLLF